MKAIYTMVGMSFRGTERLVRELPEGTALSLEREPTNRYDPNAVKVLMNDKHVAYVKGTEARSLAMHMDKKNETRRIAKYVSRTGYPAAETDE